ncbi:MAG: helix-turn-helix domain-containing protein [Verrucomicrobia bacterium]|nr:helix-turn-helix domain-containing protein [Verrucomicrobiota bacterium]
MRMLRNSRESRGYSQRLLARKAGVSFRCVQQLESDEHNWRVESMQRVGHALGLPAGGLDYFCGRYFSLLPDSVEDISVRIHQVGFDSWKIHLFDFVDRFRSDQSPDLIERPPIIELDVRIRALIASTVESLCAECGLTAPSWCRGIPALEHPWFVSGVENLKASALVESSPVFRARNIFVLGNFLERA